MEKKVVVVCLLVSILNLLSVGLAFADEMTKIKTSGIIRTENNQCLYPHTPASLLGMLSTLFLLSSHLGIHTAAGYICSKRQGNRSDSEWTVGLICHAISWVVFVLAVLLLLQATSLNDQRWNGAASTNIISFCNVAGDGIFSSGAVLGLVSNFFGMVYYLVTRPINGIVPVEEEQMHGSFFEPGDIAMVQLEPPQPAALAAGTGAVEQPAGLRA